MAIRAVVFDIGGVLEVTPPTGCQDRWAAKLGLRWSEIETRLNDGVIKAGSLGRASLEEVEHRTAELLGLSEVETTEFMEDMWTEYLGTLNVELARYFASLRPRFRTGIVSNSFVGARERERGAYNFEVLCDLIVYSHEEGVSKPDPRIYEIALERLDIDPSEAVFLDDQHVAVEGARSVGMSSNLYLDNDQAIRDLQACLNPGP